ncbi:hypothetical protein Tco_0134862 [Tanacetum coccineum]
MPGCSWRGHLRWVHILFITAWVFLEGTPAMGTYSFHYCPGVLGGDTCDGYIFFSLLPEYSWRGHLRWVHILFINAWVFLEETPAMGTYYFHYCPGVLGGDTYDGYISLISVSASVS